MSRNSNPTGNAIITRTTEKAPIPDTGIEAVVLREPHYVDIDVVERQDPDHTHHTGEFDRMEALAAKLVQVPKSEVDEKRKNS